MNTNPSPTPEEIKQFEKDNPQLAAPKELSQWPIRVALILIPTIIGYVIWPRLVY